ncbi:MAG: 2OG-Fe(II) oxygenase [Halioglobus sp.]
MNIADHDPIIQLDQTGTCIIPKESSINYLRHHFSQHHWFRLPALLNDALLNRILDGLVKGDFFQRKHSGLAKNSEYVLKHCAPVAILDLVFNNQDLLSLVKQVTGHTDLSASTGRVYQLDPSQGHSDAWHDDDSDGRRVAYSLNLSTSPYQGGALWLREAQKKQSIQEITNEITGNVLFFCINSSLEHRVAPLNGSTPKTAYAGWFHVEQSFKDRFANP